MSICVNLNRNCAVIGRRAIINTQRYFQTSALSYNIQNFDSKKENDSGEWGKWLKPMAITGALIASCVFTYKYLQEKGENKEGILKSLMPSIAAAIPTIRESNRGKFNFLADIVEKATPAVVYIEIKDKRHVDYYSREPITVSNGSGFIVDSNGLILTNAHVVINKAHTFLVVKLHDGRQFEGRVESVDPQSDLATVRIKCKNLPTLKLGQSSQLRTGEWVVAMGSPLALSNSVTAGVISSMRPSKELGLRDTNIDYIQTDAAITFGNSGGPLINLDGEAIGINSMKVTTGISFAIPIDYVSKFLDESKKHRREEFQPPVARRFLGITMLTLTHDILTELRQRIMLVPADIKSGVLVWKVILGSPAHIGGLHPGDIITHINGKQVSSTNDIYSILAEKGKPLDTIVQRGMEKLRLRIEPEEIEDE